MLTWVSATSLRLTRKTDSTLQKLIFKGGGQLQKKVGFLVVDETHIVEDW